MPVARVALPIASDIEFDYWAPDGLGLTVGSVVQVPFGQRQRVGVITAIGVASDLAPERLLPIAAIGGLLALPPDVCALVRFVAEYYQTTPGLAFALAVPPFGPAGAARRAHSGWSDGGSLALTDAGATALAGTLTRAPAANALLEQLQREGSLSPATISALSPHARRTLAGWLAANYVARPAAAVPPQAFTLNEDQRTALTAIDGAEGSYAAMLLHGITGSGKTAVYLAAAREVINRGGQVLLLVPEINLTPQLCQRVAEALPTATIATLHSALPDGERRRQWSLAANGEANLVLGTRLAVFAPLPRLALIIVDEEHDASYKQQDGVRYHARDIAVWRARQRQLPILLGSATPSLESWRHAQEGRYRLLSLPRRADPRAVLPAVRLVPHRPATERDGIGAELRAAIALRLERGEQSLLFVNRRGYAPALKCTACGWEAGCPRCSARLTTHRQPPSLRCHHCGRIEALPRACPQCGNVDLSPRGFGTQRLERALAEAFPQARIARVDRDTTRARGAFAAVRRQVADNELDILVGTQMLAKGHDFPRLTLVGVLGADNALYSADFRATERLFALLLQVGGRAGRESLPGEVIVQTDFPEHPVYAALPAHDFAGVARALLDERRAVELPPYGHVAVLVAEAHARSDVDAFLHAAHAAAEPLLAAAPGVTVHSPVASLLARRAGFERGQIVLQAERRGPLQALLARWRPLVAALPGRSVRWVLDVDPAGLA